MQEQSTEQREKLICSRCKNEMPNRTYGSQCEDCWVNATAGYPNAVLVQEDKKLTQKELMEND